MNKYISIALLVVAVNGLASYFDNNIAYLISIIITGSLLVYLIIDFINRRKK